MKAEILSVGTELLLGDIVNTNAQFLSKELASLGIDVYFQATAGDNPERLYSVLKEGFKRSDLIISTGGLGPTADDLTKETVADFFGTPLVKNDIALERIERFFKKIDREMTENNIKQAFVPEGAIVMQNRRGTAPGVIIEKVLEGFGEGKKIMIMLPGPPKEAEAMFEAMVRPFLEKRQENTFVSRIMRIADIGESTMEAMARDLLDSQNPTVAPYAKPMESYLRITAKAHNKEEADALIDPVAKEICRRFKDAVYAEGETTMEEVVGGLLIEKGLKIAVAESLTGGLVCAGLIETPGISKVLIEGIVAYSNESKIKRLGVAKETLENFGAVSAETAMEMARGAAELAGTDIGISTTGIAGPGGGSEQKPVGTVYIGVCIKVEDREKLFAKKLSLAGTRERIRQRSVYLVLDCLRRELLYLDK